MLSIIVPAHNEAQFIGPTLAALADAVRGLDEPHEIVVVNDSSSDATGAIAKSHGARVVDVNVHQIAAARNAGARAAAGDLFVFVDADTIVPPRLLRAALDAMRRRGRRIGRDLRSHRAPMGAPRDRLGGVDHARRAMGARMLLLRPTRRVRACRRF